MIFFEVVIDLAIRYSTHKNEQALKGGDREIKFVLLLHTDTAKKMT